MRAHHMFSLPPVGPMLRLAALGLALAGGLVAFTSGVQAQGLPSQSGAVLAPLVAPDSAQPPPPWRVLGLPQPDLPLTQYRAVVLDGQRVLQLAADASYASLAHALPPQVAGQFLRWRWRLEQPNPAANLRQKASDDSPLKVCVAFDLPLAAVPFVERQVMRLARARTGEHLPAATVCYVWDSVLPAGTALDNVYSRRLRWLVLRGPEAPLKTWQVEQRDVRADFLRLFADEASTVPPLQAVLVGADADNTRGRSLAFVDALRLD
jgi:hypothetical protein